MNDTIKNNPAEDELDAIRLALYEQTKGMTASIGISNDRQNPSSPRLRENGDAVQSGTIRVAAGK